MATRRRRGVVYNMDVDGLARILVNRDVLSIKGILETRSGDILSLEGKWKKDKLMDLRVVDGEAGCAFLLQDVVVQIEREYIVFEHADLGYSHNEKLTGIRASKEIQGYLDPKLIEGTTQEVFLGNMQLSLRTVHQVQPVIRRESVCEDSTRILEQSDDFFA